MGDILLATVTHGELVPSLLQLAGIVVLGIIAQWLAWRSQLPAILPLILIGLCMGPIAEMLFGAKIIDPIYNPEAGTGLFTSSSLFDFVALSIGVILFEGSLTLKRNEIRGVGSAILKLITLGSLITFIGGGLLTWLIMQAYLDWQIAFLFSALVIVTGPTVIAPILRNVPLKQNVATVLKWEGILIDPLGALVAFLMFSFITKSAGGSFDVVAEISKIIVVGVGLGVSAAFGLAYLIKRHLIPHYLLNVFTLALVIGVFAVSDVLAHESGLLTVVVMGMALANMNVPNIEQILDFKESMTVLLISVLFIVLSANINESDIENLLASQESFLVFFAVIFILRPLGVLLSAQGSDLTFKERLFISWIGPRGIVAAGVASLFGLQLTEKAANSGAYIQGAELVTPLVFMVVLGTVLLNATTARFVARRLGVILDSSSGILMVGANKGARLIAQYLQDQGRRVVLVDTNHTAIEKAKEMGLQTLQKNIYSEDIEDSFDLLDIGYTLALTSSDEVNHFACTERKDVFGENGAYRLLSKAEMEARQVDAASPALFGPQCDSINFSEVARDYPEIHEVAITDQAHLQTLFQNVRTSRHNIPLFYKSNSGNIEPIYAHYDANYFNGITVMEGDHLVYMGQQVKEIEGDK